MTQTPFGEIEHMAWWTIKGFLKEEDIIPFAQAISDLVGMTLDGDPDIRNYRSDDHREGKGGVGEQAYFAWVESWMMIGTWPERQKVRVAMSTCAIERFFPIMVSRFLEKTLGEIITHGETPW